MENTWLVLLGVSFTVFSWELLCDPMSLSSRLF